MTLTLAFLGPQETIVIALLLLLLLGAKKLPELARGMGKSMGEFKKAREEFEEEVSKGEDQARKDDDKS
jgi:sec-independent protein translocase protein TatA